MPDHRDDRRGQGKVATEREKKELEVALPDGDDLLEFEDAGDLKARIRVIGVRRLRRQRRQHDDQLRPRRRASSSS